MSNCRTQTLIGAVARSMAAHPHFAGSCALVIVAFALYANGLSAPFTFDDASNVRNNPELRSMAAMAGLANESRAVGYFSFAVNYFCHARNPWPYRLTNIALHASAAVVLYRLLYETLVRAPQWCERHAQRFALAIALLWLVHPLQTGSVTYIVQRFESLMGLFFWLGLYAVLKSATAGTKQAWCWQLAAVVFCWLGLFTKEVMIAFLPVSLLYDRAFLAPSWRDLLRQRFWLYGGCTLGMVALFAVTSITYGADGNTTAGFHSHKVTPWEYFRTQPEVILHYLRLIAWPSGQSLDYGWPVQHDPRVYISLGLVVLALLITAVVGYVRQPIVGFWGLAFFLVLGPTSSFLPIDDLAFEHRLYVPLAGALVLGGLLVSRMAVMLIPQPHARERVLLALFMVTCLGWGSCTVYRNALYANDVALWKSVVAVNPQHPRAWNNLAGAHRLKREHAAARDCLETALRLKPTDMFALWRLPLVLLDLAEKKQDPQLRATVRSLGERLMEAHPTNARHRVTFIKLLTALGETDEAEQACVALAATLSDPTLAKEFQRKRPRWDSPTLDLDPLADTWFQWALILHARGDTQGAWEKLALARQRAAADPAVPFQQGVVLAAAGRHSEAEACYRQAIDLDTSHEVAWNNLGVLLVQLQRAQEAAECYRTALYWHPEYVEALDNLGNWYARSRRYREALALYERALASDANYEPARKHHDLALARLKAAASQGESRSGNEP